MTISSFIEHLKRFEQAGEGEVEIVVQSDDPGKYTFKGACILIETKSTKGKVLALVSFEEGERIRKAALDAGDKVEKLHSDSDDSGMLH